MMNDETIELIVRLSKISRKFDRPEGSEESRDIAVVMGRGGYETDNYANIVCSDR